MEFDDSRQLNPEPIMARLADQDSSNPDHSGAAVLAADEVPLAYAVDPFAEPRPRWWTSFAICGISLFSFLCASAVCTLVAILVVHGSVDLQTLKDEKLLTSVMGSRLGLFIMVVLPQAALVAPCIIAAYLSPVEFCRRLSLVRGRWPLWTWVAAALATPLVGMVSAIVVSMFMNESETLRELSSVFRNHGQTGFLIPLALMIGMTPAFCEELLFRGYMQTRLTRSFGPVAGVLVASTLFAAFHMDLVHVIAVLPLGLYLGVVTWLSGSLFPAMLGHFVNNSISVVLAVNAPADEPAMLAAPALALMAAILACGAAGLAAVCYASITYGPPDQRHIA